jgi:hypothetical protein
MAGMSFYQVKSLILRRPFESFWRFLVRKTRLGQLPRNIYARFDESPPVVGVVDGSEYSTRFPPAHRCSASFAWLAAVAEALIEKGFVANESTPCIDMTAFFLCLGPL